MTAAPLGHKACKTSRHKPILLVFFPSIAIIASEMYLSILNRG